MPDSDVPADSAAPRAATTGAATTGAATNGGGITDGARSRLLIRAGRHRGLTTGMAAGFVQANIAILPARYADDFVGFCEANAAACPLLAVGKPGETGLPALGSDIDIRRDLPGYRVNRDGVAADVEDITALWQDDFVTVAIGCWFSMEEALLRAGVRLRHLELGIQGPLFRTSRATRPCGIFRGPLVASMRPFRDEQVETVAQITARFPRVHGAPLHAGDPAALGILDVTTPDWGEVLVPEPGETPLFWGCGLTALAALQTSGIPLFITHAPGKMLITDLRNEAFEQAS
jgi:uncharacterized protein YcsI (UPF0317 family)